VTTPRLSLCMIVRDEAALLPRFLTSVQGLWDELCVVDTGSVDDTIPILAEAGARIFQRPWTDDFAAARNAGLAWARGAWILFLDADELVDPAFVREARALLDDETAGAATLVMKNPLPHGHHRRSRLLRMFRNDPSIRFRHAIHEEVESSVLAYLAREGQRMAALQSEVLHLGYVRGRAASRDKKARDLGILRRCLAADGRDFYSWFKLLELARFWNDEELLRETAGQAAARLERAGAEALAKLPYGGMLVALIARGLYPDHPADAVEWMELWSRALLPSAAFHLARGEQYERLGRVREAAAAFEACFPLAAVTADEQLATIRPRMGLARLALGAGDLEGAWKHVAAAIAQAPRDPETLLAAATLARARGGATALASFVAEQRALHPEAEQELAEALADEALHAGLPDEAIAHLQHAAGVEPRGDSGLRLAQALLAAGRVEPARELALALMPEVPEAGLGVLLCDLVSDRSSDLELALEPAAAQAAMRRWVEPLLAAPRRELVARLRRNVPAVAPLFPWLPAHLAARAAG
jgi:glycosyltransferase involved in cell wall biosynthesis